MIARCFRHMILKGTKQGENEKEKKVTEPGAQGLQVLAPGLDWKVPGAHKVHAWAKLSIIARRYKQTCALKFEYDPGAHCPHKAAPEFELKLPAGH
jgi:hypothetical protein